MENTESKKFVLEIDLESDAMVASPNQSIASALREVANRIENTVAFENAFNKAVQLVPVFDVNGNRVGAWSVEG